LLLIREIIPFIDNNQAKIIEAQTLERKKLITIDTGCFDCCQIFEALHVA
jgi:hypothetical protein